MCVCVCVCVSMYVCVGVMSVWQGVWVWGRVPGQNDLKLGVVVVIEIVSQSTDFGFKVAKVRVGVRVRESAPIASPESVILSGCYCCYDQHHIRAYIRFP